MSRPRDPMRMNRTYECCMIDGRTSFDVFTSMEVEAGQFEDTQYLWFNAYTSLSDVLFSTGVLDYQACLFFFLSIFFSLNDK